MTNPLPHGRSRPVLAALGGKLSDETSHSGRKALVGKVGNAGGDT